VLRRIFEPEREEVIEGWRRLHIEEFHNLCALPNIIRVELEDGMGWACSTHGRDEKCVSSRGRLGSPCSVVVGYQRFGSLFCLHL
jgi:hypothetical protein